MVTPALMIRNNSKAIDCGFDSRRERQYISLNRITESVFGSGFFLIHRRYISIVTFIALGFLCCT